MKANILKVLALWPMVVNAESTGKDIYINAAIGVGVFIGVLFSVPVYKLGKYCVIKINPNTPKWLQKIIGALTVFGGWSLWISLTE